MRRALALALLLAAGALAPAEARAAIDLSGSNTVRPLMADLAFFYRQEVRRPPRFTIVGGGSEAGVADVARGLTDAGMVVRAPEPTDPPGLVFTPFAAGAICLVTHPTNPVPSLSRVQLQELVAGTVPSWSAVPGATRADAIVPVTFQLGSAARSVFLAAFVDPQTPLDETARGFGTAAQVRDFIRATPAAWGYVDLAFTGGLHRVAFEGIACARETIAGGSYPARRELALVTRGEPRGQLRRFVRWLRSSRTARRVIATRYVPFT